MKRGPTPTTFVAVVMVPLTSVIDGFVMVRYKRNDKADITKNAMKYLFTL